MQNDEDLAPVALKEKRTNALPGSLKLYKWVGDLLMVQKSGDRHLGYIKPVVNKGR